MIGSAIEAGVVGSPVDVATFILVLVVIVKDLRPDIATVSAAVVALAESDPEVLDDRLASELDVDDIDVDALRPVARPGDVDGDR